jgi:hypothetical protein
MSDQNNPQNEEVDLGQLFKMIGNIFSNFFNFIGNIFKGAFRFLIIVLIHFYKALKWYAAALIIGLIVGFVLDKKADNQYGAHLYIETNFDSSRQVYENIQNLNQIASVEKDSVELASILGLTSSEAAKIKGFKIEPDIDENTMIKLFGEYRESLDSVSKLTAKYDNFKKNLSSYSFKIHKIQVRLVSKEIPKNLRKDLVDYLVNNEYLESIRDKTKLNFEQETATIEKQTAELDSLSLQYLKIRVNESNKESVAGSGTNLFMANGSDQNSLLVDESELLEKKYELEERKRDIEIEKLEKQEIINVISDFPKSAYDISTIITKNKFKYPLSLFGLTFFVLMALNLMKYLKEQDELMNSK